MSPGIKYDLVDLISKGPMAPEIRKKVKKNTYVAFKKRLLIHKVRILYYYGIVMQFQRPRITYVFHATLFHAHETNVCEYIFKRTQRI